MTRRHSLVEALLGLAGLATLAAVFGALAFALGLLIAEREKAARIEAFEIILAGAAREDADEAVAVAEELIAEECAR